MYVNQSVKTATVQGISAFVSLTVEQQTEISQLLTIKNYTQNQYIISTSQKSGYVYFLLNGQVRACVYTGNGKEIQFEDLNPGMCFGELAAIDGGDRSSDCLAIKPVTVAMMENSVFLDVLNSYPKVNHYILIRLSQMCRRHIERVYEYTAFTVKDRIRFELLRLASDGAQIATSIKIDNAPTHSDIASRISTHREAVTRELKRLEGLEIITWRPGTHIVHDVAALTKPI